MKIKKFLLVLVLAFCVLCMTNEVQAANTTVEALKQKFPQGRYWNYGNVDGTTTTPCNHNITWDTCNSFEGSSQCDAFARKLLVDYYGGNSRNNNDFPVSYTSHMYVKPGDMIHYYAPDVSSQYGHAVWVIARNGNNVTVAECNYGNVCEVRWDRTFSLETITASTVLSAPYAIETASGTVTAYIDINSLTASSYKVCAQATGDVKDVRFPTWTNTNGQDDLKWIRGSYNSSTGLYEATIRKSDFGNKIDMYTTHVYGFKSASDDNSADIASDGLRPIPMGCTLVTNIDTCEAKIYLKENVNYLMGIENSKLTLKKENIDDGSQIWQIIPNGDNTYTLKHRRTMQVLDMPNFSDVEGTRPTLHTSTSTRAQKIYILNYGGGYRFVPATTMDLKGFNLYYNTVADGTVIDLNQALTVDNPAQIWNIEKLGKETISPYIDVSSITENSYKVCVKASSGVKDVRFPTWGEDNNVKWLVGNYNSTTGMYEITIRKSDFGNQSGMYQTHVYAYPSKTADQDAYIRSKGLDKIPLGSTVVTDLGDFNARIYYRQDGNYMIGLNDLNVQLEAKNVNDNSQIWKFTKNSDNTYTIENLAENKVLTVKNGIDEDGTRIIVKENNSLDTQKFYIMKYSSGYRIVSKSSIDMKALNLNNNNIAEGTVIDLNQALNINNPAQMWKFEIIVEDDKDDDIVQNYANVSYQTHIQNIGWQGYVSNGSISGTEGKGLRLEGIRINVDSNLSGGIEYRTHVQNIGWQDYVANNGMSGTSNRGLRLEGISIRLTGELSNYYDIYYRTHVQNVGWLSWAKNDQVSGSSGYGYRLEGIQIAIVEKGKNPPTMTPAASRNDYFAEKVNVSYSTHTENIGWQKYVGNGAVQGAPGRHLRIEGIKINLDHTTAGDIKYSTHIQNIGWQDVKSNGDMSGTSGMALRLEAIKIYLTGDMANKYDIYYRIHVEDIGWLDWAKNGAEAGSTGYGKKLEGIQVIVQEKGKAAPGKTDNPCMNR